MKEVQTHSSIHVFSELITEGNADFTGSRLRVSDGFLRDAANQPLYWTHACWFSGCQDNPSDWWERSLTRRVHGKAVYINSASARTNTSAQAVFGLSGRKVQRLSASLTFCIWLHTQGEKKPSRTNRDDKRDLLGKTPPPSLSFRVARLLLFFMLLKWKKKKKALGDISTQWKSFLRGVSKGFGEWFCFSEEIKKNKLLESGCVVTVGWLAVLKLK